MMLLLFIVISLGLIVGAIFVLSPQWFYKHLGRKFYCAACADQISERRFAKTVRDIEERARYSERQT